jgi:hypothetical protein
MTTVGASCKTRERQSCQVCGGGAGGQAVAAGARVAMEVGGCLRCGAVRRESGMCGDDGMEPGVAVSSRAIVEDQVEEVVSSGLAEAARGGVHVVYMGAGADMLDWLRERSARSFTHKHAKAPPTCRYLT